MILASAAIRSGFIAVGSVGVGAAEEEEDTDGAKATEADAMGPCCARLTAPSSCGPDEDGGAEARDICSRRR
jgi:hypothetical protein